ncbi:MAG: efflux RND transporter periplasmic adaptor subunit [Proteobacteria bacterium]|nr:efflux RND transporter periplasmic adaptor subunit [Pseudomonadota bacterium]
MRFRDSFTAVLFALVATQWLAGCGDKAKTAETSAPPVLVAPVESRRVEDRIEATGELRAQNAAAIAAQVGGQVTKLVRDEGVAAAANDVVIEIDPERRDLEARNARAMWSQADAQASEAERDLTRIEMLHKEGVAADAKLDSVRTQLRLARSNRDAAQAQLGMAERGARDSSVRAPFAGLIARRYVSEGEFVQPGQKLFDLVALDPIEVEFTLPERDSSRVVLGQPVAVRVAPFPDEVFQATVSVVAPTIDPMTRTLRVKARMSNTDGRLRPGLFARADLGVSVRENVVMIPEEAVLQRADGAVAYRINAAGRAERRVMKLGVIRDGRVEVIEGLAAGDRIVVRGSDQLVNGSAVSLREATGEAAATSGVGAAAEKTAQAEKVAP